MGTLFILIGCALFVLGIVALFKPMPRIWLKTRTAAAVALVASLVSCGIGGSMMPAAEVAPDTAPASPAEQVDAEETAAPAKARPGTFTKISMAEYTALQTGMSYAEAVEIIGEPGEEMSRSDLAGITTVAYGWQNVGGANAMLMFQDDQLVQKSQFGLR